MAHETRVDVQEEDASGAAVGRFSARAQERTLERLINAKSPRRRKISAPGGSFRPKTRPQEDSKPTTAPSAGRRSAGTRRRDRRTGPRRGARARALGTAAGSGARLPIASHLVCAVSSAQRAPFRPEGPDLDSRRERRISTVRSIRSAACGRHLGVGPGPSDRPRNGRSAPPVARRKSARAFRQRSSRPRDWPPEHFRGGAPPVIVRPLDRSG